MSASGIVNKSCPHPHHPCAVSLDKKSTTTATTTTTTSVSYVRRPQPQSLKACSLSNNSSSFHGFKILLPQKQKHQTSLPLIQMKGGLIGKAHKWWEKGVQPNMKEITSAQDLVTSLLNAGDQLVIVDFFSPGCGGCKALHPKICQFAEMNPDVEFLKVNYEDHKSMAYSLNVHVLPFFRFYRGAHGRLCSFSCTNATVKKFKDALAKHTTLRCSLGPTKGLDESELFALAANKDLNFNYTPNPTTTPLQVPHLQPPQELPAPALAPANNLPSTSIKNPSSQDKQKTLVAATSS